MARDDRSVGCALVEPTDATIIVVNYQGRGVLGACLDGVARQVGATLRRGRRRQRISGWLGRRGRGPRRRPRRAQRRERRLRRRLQPGGRARTRPAPRVPEPRQRSGAPLARLARRGCRRRPGHRRRPGRRAHARRLGQHGREPPALPRILVGAGARRMRPTGPPYEITCGSGASLLVPRARFEEVGGFWDELFLYAEDTDLSWRLRLAGLRILACPAARSEHAYEFGRNPEKYFHLERNRLLVLSANYETATLVRLAPLLRRHRGGAARGRRAGRLAAAEAAGRARRRGRASRTARPAPPRAADAAGRRRAPSSRGSRPGSAPSSAPPPRRSAARRFAPTRASPG